MSSLNDHVLLLKDRIDLFDQKNKYIQFPIFSKTFNFCNISSFQSLSKQFICIAKGSVQKPQSRLCAVMGGVPPPCRDFFPVNFLAGRVP